MGRRDTVSKGSLTHPGQTESVVKLAIKISCQMSDSARGPLTACAVTVVGIFGGGKRGLVAVWDEDGSSHFGLF